MEANSLLTCPKQTARISSMDKQVHITDNELHDQIKISSEETRPYDGWSGFPGCGDGQDDLADYNQNEGWGDW